MMHRWITTKSILLKGKIGSTLISTQTKASQEQIEKNRAGFNQMIDDAIKWKKLI